MDELHHAWIVSEFYRLLRERFAERGLAAFKQAAQTYGEQRGKRMAMRAAADGHAPDFEGYFAYGEYPSTEGYFDVEMWCETGVVNEKVTRCPWAKVFAERGLKDCGAAYCREIDRAIVRGFNPELTLETASTQHYEGCCRFFFRDAAVAADTLDKAEALTAGRADIRRPMDYHCAHVYAAFRDTVHGVFGAQGDALCADVAKGFADSFGEALCSQLLRDAQQNFDTID